MQNITTDETTLSLSREEAQLVVELCDLALRTHGLKAVGVLQLASKAQSFAQPTGK